MQIDANSVGFLLELFSDHCVEGFEDESVDFEDHDQVVDGWVLRWFARGDLRSFVARTEQF